MKYLRENRNKIKNINNQYRYLNFFLLKTNLYSYFYFYKLNFDGFERKILVTRLNFDVLLKLSVLDNDKNKYI